MNQKKFRVIIIVICLFLLLIQFGCGDMEKDINKTSELTVEFTTAEMNFRDPYILPDPNTRKYYAVGTVKGNSKEVVYCESEDLENWKGYGSIIKNEGIWAQIWAPELHYYNGNYYLLVNMRRPSETGDLRGSYILKADSASGDYVMYSDRITPENWECLDATLYIEDGIPYMVYCKEWVRTIDGNGEMYAVRLKDDLSGVYSNSQHTLLFKAKDHTISNDGVTDGPTMYKASNGDLVMLWSKYINGKYAIISSRSKSGKLLGEWSHDLTPLYLDDGGHPCVFLDFDGNLKVSFHTDNSNKLQEKPVIRNLVDNNGVITIE